MNTNDPTTIAPAASDSVLLTLARLAVADAAPGDATWPHLDLDDPAQRRFGDYELLEELERGGMGVVYRARQHSLERDVAIKFIAAGIADSQNVARFLSEARAAAKLMHPNIMPVYEVGSVDGLYYFSMPLARGRTLATVLDGAMMPRADAIALVLQLCDAIAYAHRYGLLHLDLKPANILLDERHEPLVADFGLARHMDAAGGVDAQEVSGTPAFMAPEQVLIKQYRLTTATDVYALGAILYRCLTGASPHGEGTPDEVIRRAAAGRVRPPRMLDSSIPRDLEAICMKCLELEPRDRYRGPADLAEDLRRVRDGLPVSVRRAGAIERLQRWMRREPRLAVAVAAAALALVGGTAATAWQWREASVQRDYAVVQRDAAERASREALAERDRAAGASALGAWLYAQESSTWEHDQGIATRTLRWLRDKLPDDESRQAAVLTAFFSALKDEKRDAAENMGVPLIEVMGSSYRRAVATALESGDDSDRYLLAARLAWFDERESSDPRRFGSLLDRAIASDPDDVEAWNTAATYCTGPAEPRRCLHPEALDRLVALDPGNAYHWLLQVQALAGGRTTYAANATGGAKFVGDATRSDPARVAELLHQAARRDRFDDHFRETWAAYPEAFAKSGLPVPELLAGPLRVMSPEEEPGRVLAMMEAASFPLAAWQSLVELCNPARKRLSTQQAYDDCRTIGRTMVGSSGSVLSRMIGSVIVRRLSRGTALERDMIEYRRRYLFIREKTAALTLEQSLSYPTATFMADIADKGELEAWIHRLEHYGVATRPPAEWQPEDANDMRLPEERT